MNGGGPLKPSSPSSWRLATAGTELAGAVAGGGLLGYWIDWHFGTAPWGLIIGASVGIVGGLYNLVRRGVHESMRMGSPSRQTPAKDEKKPGGLPPESGDHES